MKTCKDCIHFDICLETNGSLSFESKGMGNDCRCFKDASRFVELPCSINDPYFTVERFCTEGGYHKQKGPVSLSCCECCDEVCDKEYRIVEHKFHNVAHILLKASGIGTYYFLTKEEAEKKIEEMK